MASISEILRQYGRQSLVAEVGHAGQKRLSKGRVCVVGAGGTGSTAILYLAAAGVSIGIVDGDTVDHSNLHRQIIHSAENVGRNKAESAAERCLALNPLAQVTPFPFFLTIENALETLAPYDLIVDATDNFTARYLLSDACVILGLPFVTGAAIGMDGQISLLRPNVTPCYRCLHPRPSPIDNGRSCANSGVLGPVPGVIGCHAAMEAMKFLLSEPKLNEEELPLPSSGVSVLEGKQLFYDATTGECFNFKLPPKDPNCQMCGVNCSHHDLSFTRSFLEDFTCSTAAYAASYKGFVSADREFSPEELSEWVNYHRSSHPVLILDVRSALQFGLATLPIPGGLQYSSITEAMNAIEKGEVSSGDSIVISIPLVSLQAQLKSNFSTLQTQLSTILKAIHVESSPSSLPSTSKFYTQPWKVACLCRRGVDSTVATRLLVATLEPQVPEIITVNITGGLEAWKTKVAPDFAMY